MELFGSIIILAGSITLFLGSLGLLRMPDLYNRMQAGTKATTLGSVFTFIGVAIMQPNWIFKMILLIVFIFLTNPISSHALARASHYIKLKAADQTIHDDLENDELGEDNDTN